MAHVECIPIYFNIFQYSWVKVIEIDLEKIFKTGNDDGDNDDDDDYSDDVVFSFFYLGFLSRTFTIHRAAGEGGGYYFNSSLPLPPASQTLRH